MEYPPRSFVVGEAPRGVTRRLLPSGAPMSTIDPPAFLLQAIQASMPAFCCSGVAFIICSNDVVGALYRTRNFFMDVPFSTEVSTVHAASDAHRPLVYAACQRPASDDTGPPAHVPAAAAPLRGVPAHPHLPDLEAHRE